MRRRLLVQLCIILLVLVGLYVYIRYEFVLKSTSIFFNGIDLKIIVPLLHAYWSNAKTPIGATMYTFVSIGRPIYVYIRYEFVL